MASSGVPHFVALAREVRKQRVFLYNTESRFFVVEDLEPLKAVQLPAVGGVLEVLLQA